MNTYTEISYLSHAEAVVADAVVADAVVADAITCEDENAKNSGIFGERRSKEFEFYISDTEDESIASTVESEYDTPFFVRISDEWLCEMETQTKDYIRDYINEHMLQFASPTFYSTMVQYVATVLLYEWTLIELCDYDDYDDIVDFVEQLHIDMLNSGIYGVPLRQEPTDNHTSTVEGDILLKIERLQSIPQSKQRTMEWYETRHNLLTASNLWKVFGSQSQYNSLIYEKCLPLETVRSEKKQMSMDSNNPMQMGVKYEPISIMMYEKLYGTKITDVGCIPHAQYSYIGASPDGINMTSNYPRYGRMIEVKNIVNREITGVPLEHYWIQMQLQMEACDLDECDFIETRFKEFDETDNVTYSDRANNSGREAEGVRENSGKRSTEERSSKEFDDTQVPFGKRGNVREQPSLGERNPIGCILYFLPRIFIGECVSENGKYSGRVAEGIRGNSGQRNSEEFNISPEYVYMPIDMEPSTNEATEWIQQQRIARPQHVLYKKTYWVLDQFSCVLVRRNREWFRCAEPKITEVWNTILKERETGYENRTTKKKKLQTEVVCSENTTTHYIKNMPISTNICLVKLDADENNL
jgi:putative phage-type endonuclease